MGWRCFNSVMQLAGKDEPLSHFPGRNFKGFRFLCAFHCTWSHIFLFLGFNKLPSIGGDLATSLRGTENFSQTKISEWRFLRKKFISIFTPKISDDLFLYHCFDHVFQIFPIYFLMFHIFTACNVIYDPSSWENPLFHKIIPWWHFFYSVRAFALIRQTLLLKILGDGCMGRPPSQIWGGPSPQSPLGLRPCSPS